ncbi:MAG: rod shape-determining protein MreC [Chloroflexi bacterium]|nr:rod shape-determining protein MreC [Chloroflexota bacterium]
MKGSRVHVLVLVIVLCLVLAWLILDSLTPSNPIKNAVSQVASPIQYALRWLGTPFRALAQGVENINKLGEENETLRKENSELRNQIILLQEAQLENEILRKELSFKSSVPSYQLLSAEVIGRDPSEFFKYLIIDRGKDDGVRVGLPVITADGLVGRISEVGPVSSKVMLVTDSSSSVSTLVQRSRATGMTQGYPGQGLIMRYIPQSASVEVGDIVLTSGLGGGFPMRLVVGQVAEVTEQDVAMFKDARVIPAVNFTSLESVMVMLSFQEQSVEPLAEPTPE